MPEVMIIRDPKIVDDNVLESISNKLTHVIAEALDVEENPDARLYPKDIEIDVIDRTKFSKGTSSLKVIIWANDYPERKKNIDDRMEEVAEAVRLIWPDAKGKGFVWTQPMGGFAKL